MVDGEPIGPGFRVPAILISPYSRGGRVCSEAFDHTSVIRFLESRFGVFEPNISDYRRQTLGDLTSAFLPQDATAGFPSLPDAAAALQRAQTEVKTFPPPAPPFGKQVMPHQAPV
jgi:phospholipase C